MATKLKFAEPPVAKRGRQVNPKWNEIVEALKENPGKWAILEEGLKPSTASNNAAMLRKKFGVNAVSRNAGDGTYGLFAMYEAK